MKALLRFLFCLISMGVFSQQKSYELWSKGKLEQKFTDSLATTVYLDSLAKFHFLTLKIKKTSQTDHRIRIDIDKGIDFGKAHILYPNTELAAHYNPKNTIQNLDSVKRKMHLDYLEQGFLFNRIGTHFEKINLMDSIPEIKLSLYKGSKRRVDSLVLLGDNKVPQRFKKNLEKQILGQDYTPTNIRKISDLIKNQPYVSLQKEPQNLFKKEKSSLYLYLKKKKNNSFDGILGFGNDKTNKVKLAGTLQMSLINSLNAFEKIQIYWQRTPDNAVNFDFSSEVPYLLSSNLGVKLQLNIYRQDSTFANVKIQPSVFYTLNLEQKIGLRANLENASIIAKTSAFGQDYSKKGFGLYYDYQKASTIDLLGFQRRIYAEGSLLNALYADAEKSITQTQFKLNAEENVHIKGFHYFNAKLEINHIQTQAQLGQNELLRFGGWNSFRGVNELSIIAKSYAFGGLEYRYLAGDTAFFDVFSQYAWAIGAQNHQLSQFLNLGLGFQFRLGFGIMSFQLSNAKLSKDPFLFDQTKIHFGIISKF